ncbi:AAA family ATPase [Herbaspirillum huttiense]|uniref:AAA family ATPase n=1 Tax=Herbaspirillum huttiense subsp. lycopersici TaxID=3074428 RepID=A0ABU2EG30_9BURK|nr:AAA family ATPase [Herbaspirillum huttiense]MDR9847099.1 AAA family ATPase [Herbaspirillum huttiense SE1]
MIGLCGAHRTGKTSLAREFAKETGTVFMQTSVSSIFTELGLDPAGTFTFSQRLDIQEEILKRLDEAYGKAPLDTWTIVDRTPIDLMGYTLAEAVGDNVKEEDQQRLKNYVNKCFDVTNRRFSSVILVQSGLPLVHEPGKAALNAAYIEHLSSLMFGLLMDERLETPKFYIRRSQLGMRERIEAVRRTAHQVAAAQGDQIRQHLLAGGMLQ